MKDGHIKVCSAVPSSVSALYLYAGFRIRIRIRCFCLDPIRISNFSGSGSGFKISLDPDPVSAPGSRSKKRLHKGFKSYLLEEKFDQGPSKRENQTGSETLHMTLKLCTYSLMFNLFLDYIEHHREYNHQCAKRRNKGGRAIRRVFRIFQGVGVRFYKYDFYTAKLF